MSDMSPEERENVQHIIDHIREEGIPPGALAELDQSEQAAWDWLIQGMQDLLHAEIHQRAGEKEHGEQLVIRRLMSLRELNCGSVRLATDLLMQLLAARMVEEWGGYQEALEAFQDEHAPLFPADRYVMPADLVTSLRGVAALHLEALTNGPDPHLAGVEAAQWLERRLIPALTYAYERDKK